MIGKAKNHHQLIKEILDSGVPKTEREQAAKKEIERLRRMIPSSKFEEA